MFCAKDKAEAVRDPVSQPRAQAIMDAQGASL